MCPEGLVAQMTGSLPPTQETRVELQGSETPIGGVNQRMQDLNLSLAFKQILKKKTKTKKTEL